MERSVDCAQSCHHASKEPVSELPMRVFAERYCQICTFEVTGYLTINFNIAAQLQE